MTVIKTYFLSWSPAAKRGQKWLVQVKAAHGGSCARRQLAYGRVLTRLSLEAKVAGNVATNVLAAPLDGSPRRAHVHAPDGDRKLPRMPRGAAVARAPSVGVSGRAGNHWRPGRRRDRGRIGCPGMARVRDSSGRAADRAGFTAGTCPRASASIRCRRWRLQAAAYIHS